MVLAASFSGDTEAHMRAIIRDYIEEATTHEWPMMAQHTVTLRVTPRSLAEALQLTLALTPSPPRARRPHSAKSLTRLKTRSTLVGSA